MGNALNSKPARAFGVATGLGLVLAAAGILTPILWERYQSRTELELQILNVSTIVEQGEGVDKIRLFYDTVSVRSVTKVDIALVNSGRASVTGQQVVEPTRVTLREGRILNAEVTGTSPSGVRASLTVEKSQQSIDLLVPLLNAGDEVRASMLVTVTNPIIDVGGRVVGVRQILLRDRRDVRSQRLPIITLPIVVVTIFTAFALLLMLFGLYITGGQRALKSAFLTGVASLPRGVSGRTLRDLIVSTFGRFGNSDTRAILESIPQSETRLPDEQVDRVEVELRAHVNKLMSGALPALLILGALSLVGIWFLWRQFS
jgi:hypothetical protein